jgi:hypothetical protein
MRSRPWPHALNYKYALYPGQATKEPPSQEEQDEGYTIDELVPPTTWNFHRWQNQRAIIEAQSAQVLNFFQSNTDAFGPASPYIVGPAGHTMNGSRPDIHTVMLNNDPVSSNPREARSDGGLIWEILVAVGLPVASVKDFDTNNSNYRAVAMGNNDGVYYSINLGSWSVWGGTFPSPARIYIRLVNRWSEANPTGQLWVFSDINGLLYYALSPTSSITLADSDPGFTVASTVRGLIHTRHGSGLLWPDDAGNEYTLAFTDTQLSRSMNGRDWSSATAHLLDTYGAPYTTPLAMDYSAFGTKWIAVIGRSTAGYTTIAYSSDNGVSWTRQDDAIKTSIDVSTARITCDRFGNWLVSVQDTAISTIEYFGSFDNGVTWYKLFATTAPYYGFHRQWYGGGRFHLATSERNTVSPYNVNRSFFHSLRGGASG